MAKPRGNEFEKSFQQLEKIVGRLESEEISLDESLRLFEEGIRLSRFCNQKLEEIEQRIELILADSKGEPVIRPFDDPDEDDDLVDPDDEIDGDNERNEPVEER